MRARTPNWLVWLALLGGCAPPAARVEPPSTPAPRPVATCVDARPGQPTSIALAELVTTARGVRWFLASRRDEPGLAWLRADGEVGFAVLPQPAAAADHGPLGWLCSAAGSDALRCYSGPSRHIDGTWGPLWTVGVALSDTPGIGALERWSGAPLAPVTGGASDGQRAVLVQDQITHGEPRDDRPGLGPPVARVGLVSLWDASTGARSQRHGSVEIAGTVEPLAAWCDRDCAVVARHRGSVGYGPASGETGRVIVVSPTGGEPQTLVADIGDDALDDALAVMAVEGGHVVVARSGERLMLVALDAAGQVSGRSQLPMNPGSDFAVLGEGLLGYRKGLDRAVHDWELLTISPTAAILERRAIGSQAIGLEAARVGDGVVVAGLTGDVSYDEAGDYAFHSWQFWAEQRFIGRSKTSEWRSLLDAETPSAGDGRGGYDVAWLVRPERAVAMLWPTGDAWGERRVIPARRPCPSPEPPAQ